MTTRGRRYSTYPGHDERRAAAAELTDLPGADSSDPVVRRAFHMAVTLGAVNDIVAELGQVSDPQTAERVAQIRARLDALRDVR
jgi:hypothetical protein